MSYFDPQLIFYSVVFLGTILLVQGVFAVLTERNNAQTRVNKRMKLLAEGASNEQVLSSLRRDGPKASSIFAPPSIVDYLEVRLTQAGMRMPVSQLIVLMISATLLIGLVFPLLGGITGRLHSPAAFLLLVIFALVLGIVMPLVFLSRKAAARIAKFEAQFPVALDIFVRGLRAGHPVTSALDLLVTEVPDPIGSEFGIVIAEMNYGYDLRGALANLARRVRTQDVQMFVVSVAVQAEIGGSLADILDGLSRVIRERASMVMKVRALAGEGKMTGILLSVLPVATFCFVFATQPKFYLDVVDDPIFLPSVMGVGIWYSIGIVIMRRLIKLEV